MLRLTLSSRDVPKLVPFSHVYLYLEDEREAIHAAFPALFELRPYQLRLDDWAKVCVHTQQPGDPRAYYKENDKDAPKLKDVIPTFFEAHSPWYMAVPTVLTTWSAAGSYPVGGHALDIEDPPPKREAKTGGVPGYLGHRYSGNWVREGREAPIPRPRVVLDPTLVVQGAPDRPVCSECPRYAHNASGECFFGDPICRSHLYTIGAPTFAQSAAKAKRAHGEHNDNTGGEAALPGAPDGGA
jgi:hypothetical protein